MRTMLCERPALSAARLRLLRRRAGSQTPHCNLAPCPSEPAPKGQVTRPPGRKASAPATRASALLLAMVMSACTPETRVAVFVPLTLIFASLVWRLRLFRQEPEKLNPAPSLDHFELALLVGGAQRLVEVTLGSLAARDLIRIGYSDVRRGQDGVATHPIERALLASLTRVNELSFPQLTEALQPSVREVTSRLHGVGYLRPSPPSLGRWALFTLSVCSLAWADGSRNGLVLIGAMVGGMCLLGLAIEWMTTHERFAVHTRAGLARIQDAWNEARAEPHLEGEVDARLLAAVAVFGLEPFSQPCLRAIADAIEHDALMRAGTACC